MVEMDLEVEMPQVRVIQSLSAGSKRFLAGDVVDSSDLPKRSLQWLKRHGHVEVIGEDDSAEDED